MIDKGISYEDKKQKKKIKPVKQAGVMNYMPSEMVTVPKIAKSSPDTPTAKLAYITPEEEKILIDLNLYGSLDGKPNRGPGGIPSLEGDFGSSTGQAYGSDAGSYSGGSGDEKVGGGGGGGPSKRDLAMGAGGKQKTGTVTDAKELSKATKTDFTSGVEKDTGLEQQRLKNDAILKKLKDTTYEDLDKNLVPPYIPYSGAINTVGNLLGSFGFEKNKDFFIENVAGKYDYGYGLEDFEQYMKDRLSGKVGAYGNVEQGQNALSRPDDATDTSGILQALLLPELTPTTGPVPEIGFNYIKPYSNQVVVAPGSQGIASLTGGQGFLSSII